MGPPTLARRAPRRWRTTPAVALAAALIVPVLATVTPAPAAAQTPDEVADAVATLGGGELDPAAAARIAALLGAAAPTVLPDGLADVDPTRVRATVEAWAIVAPEWRTVGLELSQRIADCRDGTTSDGCGDELRAQLWLRHAEELRRTLEGRFGAAADLTDEERVRLEFQLVRTRDRAMERLRLLEDCDAEQLRRLEQSCEALQERLREHIDELGRLGPAGREGRP